MSENQNPYLMPYLSGDVYSGYPPMPMGMNMGMGMGMDGYMQQQCPPHGRGKKRSYYAKAPSMHECVILPIELQDNKELMAVSAAVAYAASLLAMVTPEEEPKPPVTPPTPTISVEEGLSPGRVAKMTDAALTQFMKNGVVGYESVERSLQGIARNIECRSGLEYLSERLVQFGTDYKQFLDATVQLIGSLSDTVRIQEPDWTPPEDELSLYQTGEGEDCVLKLGVGNKSIGVLDIIEKNCLMRLETCDECEVARIATFITKLGYEGVASEKLVKACVAKIILGAPDFDDYVDETSSITASPIYVKRAATILETSHPGLLGVPYCFSAITFAAHINEFYLDEDTAPDSVCGRAKSSPLPLISAIEA
eukprot:TRINITY_DN998_c0_g1_i1.p1 TRINITY_DN998_c0_g1~~TRINITY_DN998_c0_g1_i1.p1  ORF type:complete len:366 (+),score=51.23 TRINITY_DN998_c0_g1_i1:117-1214(+)